MLDVQEVREDTTLKKRRELMDSIWWGGVLIWIGLALGSEWLGILPEIGDRGAWWPWIFIGVGPWSLILNSYFLSSPTWPKPTTWDWIWTAIFMLVAVGTFVDIGGELLGALVLVGVGVAILIRSFAREGSPR